LPNRTVEHVHDAAAFGAPSSATEDGRAVDVSRIVKQHPAIGPCTVRPVKREKHAKGLRLRHAGKCEYEYEQQRVNRFHD
jgi:hypothetical protein